MKNFKNAILALINWIFGTHYGEVIETEADHPIDLNLAKENDYTMTKEIIQLVNDHRGLNGLPPVELGDIYSCAYAVRHTKYMIDQGKISHDDFHVRNAGMKFRGAKRVGENVAYGYNSAESVVDAWINSDAHRGIIEGKYNFCSMGILKNDKGRYYFSQLFYYRKS